MIHYLVDSSALWRILREPANIALNLQFARMAEERGTLRWALMAYERVLLNNPDNFDAKMGLMRVKAARDTVRDGSRSSPLSAITLIMSRSSAPPANTLP